MGNILAPFKKFLSNKNTITILGVLLGVVVLFLGYKWRVNEAINPTSIVYSTRTIIQGDMVNADDVDTTTISGKNLKNMGNVINNQADIVGKIVSYDCKVPINSYFFNECLIDEDQVPDSIFSTIPNGYTIFTLPVTIHTTYGNSIFPDDTIDIYLHTESDEEEGKVIYGQFIKQIQVLAVKDGEGKNVFADRENLAEPALLLFSVPEDLYLLLSKAVYVGMELVPVVRNSSYSASHGETEIESDFLKNYVLDKTVQIPDENVAQSTTVAGTETTGGSQDSSEKTGN